MAVGKPPLHGSVLFVHRSPGVDDVGEDDGDDERYPAHGGEGEARG